MKLKQLVINNKFHPPKEDFNVVYRYKCTQEECHSSYIGYTEATVKERMRNHAQNGSIIKHLREVHDIRKIATTEMMKSVEILARGNTKNELLILEALFIKELKPNLNEQEEGRDRILKIF